MVAMPTKRIVVVIVDCHRIVVIAVSLDRFRSFKHKIAIEDEMRAARRVLVAVGGETSWIVKKGSEGASRRSVAKERRDVGPSIRIVPLYGIVCLLCIPPSASLSVLPSLCTHLPPSLHVSLYLSISPQVTTSCRLSLRLPHSAAVRPECPVVVRSLRRSLCPPVRPFDHPYMFP